MTEPTPAEELRAAAERLDSLTAAAPGGDWRPGGVGNFGWTVHCGPDQGVETDDDGAEGLALGAYIAAMGPVVGRALAAWLRDTAERVDAVARKRPDAADPTAPWIAHPLAVARAINASKETDR